MITMLLLAVAAAKLTATPSPVPTQISITRSQKAADAPADESATGQPKSLADAVRQSQAKEQPEQKKRSLGTITNDSLKGGGPTGTPRASKGTLNAAPATSTTTTSYTSSEPADSKGRTEASWREGAQKSRDKVAAAEKEIQKLEKESRQLENDYYAWSDGTYRDNVIKPAWDQARAALVTARENLERARKAQEDTQEEARKSGVPPGWLREGAKTIEPKKTPSSDD